MVVAERAFAGAAHPQNWEHPPELGGTMPDPANRPQTPSLNSP